MFHARFYCPETFGYSNIYIVPEDSNEWRKAAQINDGVAVTQSDKHSHGDTVLAPLGSIWHIRCSAAPLEHR